MAPIISRISSLGGGGTGGFTFGKRKVPTAGGGGFSATGGTVTAAGITPGNGYRYHVFTAPGTFTVTNS